MGRTISHDVGFVEIADRCWVARYRYLDISIGLVGGERGVVVVDTTASEVQARRVVDDLRRLGLGELVGVVNTHEHFDHTFGNAVFDGVPLHAQEEAAARTIEAGERVKERYADSSDPEAPDVIASRILPAENTFSSVAAIDLGDRVVELLHPGRGHTGGDLVVRVPDADIVYAGDLIEESALRNGVPYFGVDCYPLEWPATLDLVGTLMTEKSVAVPGHGVPVDKDFVERQRGDIGAVAETIRDLASRGVPVSDALAAADWPYPVEELEHAVRRGYEHLPRSAKTLPLL